MIKRKTIGTMIAGMVIGAAALPLVAFAAANTSGLKGITLQGVGTGQLANGDCAAIACKTANTCECLSGADTVIQAGIGAPWNKGSFTFVLSVDPTSSPLPISNVGDCLPATGSGILASANGKVQLLMDVSGLACPTSDDAAEVFNGTYHVTGGSGGKNPATHGTGSINGSLALPGVVGATSRITIDGNTQP